MYVLPVEGDIPFAVRHSLHLANTFGNTCYLKSFRAICQIHDVCSMFNTYYHRPYDLKQKWRIYSTRARSDTWPNSRDR